MRKRKEERMEELNNEIKERGRKGKGREKRSKKG
jgi:hypothetical protein